MGRRLSMFCPCLPRRQRDNLSSRAFYPDQDSSGYSDNDDHDNDHDHSYSAQYPRPLSYFQQHHSRTEDHSSITHPNHDNSNNNNDNPWPSNFYNGRFSRQVNRSYEGESGRNSPRRPNNPFRTLSQDKGGRETDTGITSFEPYRDDHEGYDDDDEEEDEHQKLLKGPPSSRSKILPKMDFPPFRVKTAFSNVDDNGTHHSLQEVRAPIAVSLSTQPRAKRRSPRNPQGRMLWKDHDDNDDNHDGMADAEDILDVDALIAEQERITKELAKQEEALRKEEEAAIVAKRMAAIRAAERRGLLRFEGDQLVIPGSDNSTDSTSSSSDIVHEVNKYAHQGQGNTRKKGTVQEDGNWNYSRRIQEMQHGEEEGIIAHPMDGTTVSTSSAASSYVGGIDAFNQELKMMTLSVDAHRSKDSKQATLTSSQMTSTATTTSPSQTRPRTVSTSAASTSNGASLPSPGTMISPRGVFSSVASFLKKVDGVIAGECEDSSSDEAESQRQQLRNNGPQGLVHQGTEGTDNSVLSGTSGTGTGDHVAAEHSQETERKQLSTIATRSESSVDAPTTASFNKKPEIAPQTSPSPAAAAVTDAPATAIDPSASGGGVLGTFSSLLSTGASLIGYFGSGAVSQHYDSDEEYHGNSRRLSTIKYGDSKTHHFNPRRRSAVEDDDDDDGIDDYNF